MFFSMLKFWFSRLSRGWKGKKWPKMLKISVCRTLYFRNHISYYLHWWWTFLYKRIIPPDISLIFFKILIIRILWGEVKGQKMSRNDKKFSLSHAVSQEPYIIWLWFLVHMCKMISQQIFSFFKILVFGIFRGIKSKKWPKITNFSLFCSISQEM